MVAPYRAPLGGGKAGTRQYGGVPHSGVWDGKRRIWAFRGKNHKVARLICEAFHGAPQPGQVCMHLDENAANNRPNNLKWGTQRENLNAPGFLAYCRARVGADNPHTKGRAKRASL
jgi:hypothetical protein